MTGATKRIWGWMLFDVAQQPYATLGLTFIFGPYFAATAASVFADGGADPTPRPPGPRPRAFGAARRRSRAS
jgi:MFS-type transporter involved in bile tolerance (Atg22 family)